MIEGGFSFGSFGPGAAGGASCVFDASLGREVVKRMGVDKALNSQALDLAFAKSEIFDVDPIGLYTLRAAKARYLDKVTGEIKEEMTLVSDDFGSEPIGVWTDAGEHSTGTQEEYTRIVGWAHELADTKGPATLIWVSPGSGIDNRPTSNRPEHRAFVLRKQTDGNVEASVYQLTGSQKTLVDMMKKLGYETNNTPEHLKEQRILRSGKDADVSHRDVYHAYKTSLPQTEFLGNRTFIEKFRVEAEELSDDTRWTKLRRNQELYQVQLERYQGDIQKALETIVAGFIAMPQIIDQRPEEIDRVREHVYPSANLHERVDTTRIKLQDGQMRKDEEVARLPEVNPEFPSRVVIDTAKKEDIKKEETDDSVKTVLALIAYSIMASIDSYDVTPRLKRSEKTLFLFDNTNKVFSGFTQSVAKEIGHITRLLIGREQNELAGGEHADGSIPAAGGVSVNSAVSSDIELDISQGRQGVESIHGMKRQTMDAAKSILENLFVLFDQNEEDNTDMSFTRDEVKSFGNSHPFRSEKEVVDLFRLIREELSVDEHSNKDTRSVLTDTSDRFGMLQILMVLVKTYEDLRTTDDMRYVIAALLDRQLHETIRNNKEKISTNLLARMIDTISTHQSTNQETDFLQQADSQQEIILKILRMEGERRGLPMKGIHKIKELIHNPILRQVVILFLLHSLGYTKDRQQRILTTLGIHLDVVDSCIKQIISQFKWEAVMRRRLKSVNVKERSASRKFSQAGTHKIAKSKKRSRRSLPFYGIIYYYPSAFDLGQKSLSRYQENHEFTRGASYAS